MAIHVTADDVHLVRMRRTDLRAVHLLPLAIGRRLRIERAQRQVLLVERVRVDARADAIASNPSTALRRIARRPLPPSSGWPRRRRVLVRDALGVRAAVALELRLDPIDGRAVPVRALASITEPR